MKDTFEGLRPTQRENRSRPAWGPEIIAPPLFLHNTLHLTMMFAGRQFVLMLAFIASLPSAASFSVRNIDSSSSSSSRRDFLQSIAITSSAAVYTVASNPSVANAGYGDSSNIVMPNYIEYLIEKNKQVDPSKSS